MTQHVVLRRTNHSGSSLRNHKNRMTNNSVLCEFLFRLRCKCEPKYDSHVLTGLAPAWIFTGKLILDLNLDPTSTYPENLSADVGGPLLFQRVSLGVLDQVCHRSCSTKLHDQLQTDKVRRGIDGLQSTRNILQNIIIITTSVIT